MLISLKKVTLGVSIFIFSLFIIQNTFAYTCPDYLFSTDLAKGATNKDVKVIQEILNLDKRTIVAQTGPGSQGNETNFFGVATREALKRFQALFIEYIGIANGKFGPKTRTSMNAVCQGPFFTGGTGSVYDVSPAVKDVIAPIIAVAGPETADINEPFRAFLGTNEPLNTPTLVGLIIEHGTASDLRKVASTTYSFLVTPNQDGNGAPITLQFEADSVEDLAGNKNDTASNEWVVKISGAATNTGYIDPLAGINLEALLPDPTPGANCDSVASVNINDTSNPCYGKVPMTGTENMSEQQQQDQQMMQMLQQLLQAVMGALKGGGSAGGACTCACTGEPTVTLLPKGGTGPIPGAHKNYTGGIGSSWVGTTMPPTGICGEKVVNGKCVNPMKNACGEPYVGNTGAPFQWN